MSKLLLLVLLLGLPACNQDAYNLYDYEQEYLLEDTKDLVSIAFQVAERAFVGDSVAPGDIFSAAGPGNDFTASYDLNPGIRAGLGYGFGIAAIQVTEDGVPAVAPIAFSFGSTLAGVVDLQYELEYNGETPLNRDSNIDFTVIVHAVRQPGGNFLLQYRVRGTLGLNATFLSEVSLVFTAPGSPMDGILSDTGDGSCFIDDPGVFDVLHLDLDWLAPHFVAEGDVGCCAFFERKIGYEDLY